MQVEPESSRWRRCWKKTELSPRQELVYWKKTMEKLGSHEKSRYKGLPIWIFKFPTCLPAWHPYPTPKERLEESIRKQPHNILKGKFLHLFFFASHRATLQDSTKTGHIHILPHAIRVVLSRLGYGWIIIPPHPGCEFLTTRKMTPYIFRNGDPEKINLQSLHPAWVPWGRSKGILWFSCTSQTTRFFLQLLKIECKISLRISVREYFESANPYIHHRK